MHWILKNILFGAPLFFLISAFAAGPDVNGETSALEHLTLADAKRLAFERNWDLLAARSSLDSATAQLLVVKEGDIFRGDFKHGYSIEETLSRLERV